MRLGVLPGCVFPVLFGMGVVGVGNMSVMGRFLMIAGFVMLCSLSMVVSSLRVVMGSLLVMMRCFL